MHKKKDSLLLQMFALIGLMVGTLIIMHSRVLWLAIINAVNFVIFLRIFIDDWIKTAVAKLDEKHSKNAPQIFIVPARSAACCTIHMGEISYDRYEIKICGCLEHGADIALFVDKDAKELAERARTFDDANSFLDQVAERQKIPPDMVAGLRAKLPDLFPKQDAASTPH